MRTAFSAVLAVLLALLVPRAALAAEVSAPAPDGSFTIEGHGWGHGRGMSQYGAQGGAELGKTADEITSFYYPHTAKTVLGNTSIRVLLQEDEGTDLQVYPATGLKVTDLASGATTTLPSGPTRWRATHDSTGFRIASLAGSTWTTFTLNGHTAFTGPIRFSGPALVRVALPGGTSRDYRTSVQAAYRTSTTLYSVAVMSMDSYLLGVVPRESSSSWPAAALQAQAIAARSYAAYKRAHAPSNQVFDICDTTQCQVFGGTNSYSSSGTRTPQEASSTNDAVKATGGVVRTYNGQPIFAEFSASNGGWSVDGGLPYLVAQQDNWDGVTGSSVHSWTATVTAAQIQARFPAVGTLQRLRVTARDGHGDWGGRVQTVVLEGIDRSGAATSVTTTGAGIYNAHSWPGSSTGLRSSWWHVKGSLDARLVARSAAPSLVQSPGTSTGQLAVQLQNTGTQPWPDSGIHLTSATTPGSQDQLVGGSTRPGVFTKNVTDPSNTTTVEVGDTAEFRFDLTADAVQPGTYARGYRLRVNTGGVFGPVVSWTVPVAAPVFKARAGTPTATDTPAGSAPPAVFADGRTVVVPRSGSTTVHIPSTNLGNVTWPVGGNVRLATSGARNRSSASYGGDWLSTTRPARLSGAGPVAPGRSGSYDLVLHGNGKPAGTTVEAFEPVWDGEHWLDGAVTTLTVVRTDPAISRVAERFYASPKVTLLNGPTGTATVRVRLRNIGGSPWTVGSEGLTTSSASPFRTSAWSSSSRPPALSSNLSRPGQTQVFPGELGEWLVPLSAFKVAPGSYSVGFRPVGPSGAYGPTSTVPVTVAKAVFSGQAVAVHPAVTMTSSGTARTWFDVKNTGNVTWAIGRSSAVRSASLTSGGSPSADASWLSALRPGTILSNLTRPGSTNVAPGETARFFFLLAGNGRSARTASEPFGMVWEGWTTAALRVTLGYKISR
ncbi:MAG: stage sporulation protein [Frankiales bacterium]|nr:stage sporulation protein [Frankiales bacterium]